MRVVGDGLRGEFVNPVSRCSASILRSSFTLNHPLASSLIVPSAPEIAERARSTSLGVAVTTAMLPRSTNSLVSQHWSCRSRHAPDQVFITKTEVH